MGAAVQVIGFDHIVLNVADPEASLAFYCDELGLEPLRVEGWREGKHRFPSIRINALTIMDLASHPRTGENLAHFCLVIEKIDYEALIASGRLDVISGPDSRFGAQGVASSIYVRDPDGNTVELRYY